MFSDFEENGHKSDKFSIEGNFLLDCNRTDFKGSGNSGKNGRIRSSETLPGEVGICLRKVSSA